jgi:predicted helicase
MSLPIDHGSTHLTQRPLWPSLATLFSQPSINATSTAQLKNLSAPDGKFSPRPDQKEAIQDVLKGIQSHDRGQLILPCGTGKTLTSLWIKEGMKNIGQEAKLTLKLVPSIALIKQTKDAWLEQKTDDFDYLCVCSDEKVTALKDQDDDDAIDSEILDELKEEIRGKVTTEATKIKAFLEAAQGSCSVVHRPCEYHLPNPTAAHADRFPLRCSPFPGCLL